MLALGKPSHVGCDRLLANRDHLEILGFYAGRSVGVAIVLGPQLLEVAAQSVPPRVVLRAERPIGGPVVGAKVLPTSGGGNG